MAAVATRLLRRPERRPLVRHRSWVSACTAIDLKYSDHLLARRAYLHSLVCETFNRTALNAQTNFHSLHTHSPLTTHSPNPTRPITCIGTQRRRRSSLAQLTDILREWSGTNASTKRAQKPQLNRRETLADLARSLPWGRVTTINASTDSGGGNGAMGGNSCSHSHAHARSPSLRKRRESSGDSGIRSLRSRRESEFQATRRDDSSRQDRGHQHDGGQQHHHHRGGGGGGGVGGNNWPPARERSPNENTTDTNTSVSTDVTRSGSRRDSGESNRSGARRDSTAPPAMQSGTNGGGGGTNGGGAKIVGVTPKKRRDSLTVADLPGNFRLEQRPSTSSTDSYSREQQAQQAHLQQLFPVVYQTTVDTGCQALPAPPTIIMSSVTPPATSPTAPQKVARRDSTTQCGRVQRRDSRASPERPLRLQRLQRQATAFDESCSPLGGGSRRGSGPALSPDVDEMVGRARRDSLSPDSASRGGRRDSRAHLSPDRSRERDGSPRRTRRTRRQSSSAGRQPRSPDSSSCCSSRWAYEIWWV